MSAERQSTRTDFFKNCAIVAVGLCIESDVGSNVSTIKVTRIKLSGPQMYYLR